MTELMPSLCNDCVARNQCGKDDVKMCISYTKEIKIKCDDCKFVEDCVDYGWYGCKKFTQKASESLTNEEYIKSLNTEQLADVLMKIFVTRTFCHLCPEGDVCDIGYKCKYSEGKKIEDWVEWLKEKNDDGLWK